MSATILLVEDDLNDAELAMRAFRKAGVHAQVVHVSDGIAAMSYLLDPARPLPTVVLLDWKLPPLGGLDVLRKIRGAERTRRLPVVVLTSSRETRDVREAYDHGANSFVTKPIPADEFAAATRDIGVYWLLRNEEPPLP